MKASQDASRFLSNKKHMELWERSLIAGAVVVLAALSAMLVDRAIARRQLAPEVATRYRVLRRTIMTAIVVVGLLSALLVIPQVRAIAGGILASGAVLGLIVGFASQRTLGNFVAGILIAFTQPLRLGDRVRVDDVDGVVEEIGLTYTWVRAEDESRFVVPNEKLASDTIRNFTIRSPEKVAEVTLQVELAQDLDAVLGVLHAETDAEAFVSALGAEATITVRKRAPSEADARLLERELRVRAHRALRAAGVFA
jgi:small-conductance mechanosensitive channel